VVTTTDWQQWQIPLDALSGVNLASVTTMYIGIGDRDNPASGGTGIVYIDDIQLGRSAAEETPAQ
jgi:hypothetical protein